MDFKLTPPDTLSSDYKREKSNDDLVCWSRMQAESGQQIESILDRKEQERLAGGGTFFWGVGNPPPREIAQLAQAEVEIKAVFSLMKGRARSADTKPESIFVWNQYIDCDGTARVIPEHSLITSRSHSELGLKKVHYALICCSEIPLVIREIML